MWRAQEQMGGWLPEPALRYVADMLGMAYIRVYEIATFYTMFNLAPVGRYYVQVCGTTPCWLRGADAIKDTCRKLIGEPGHVTRDGLFSWIEVECLGACVNAPMAQINKDYYEDLTPESMTRILKDMKAGRHVEPGPQDGRQASAPAGGPITLTDADLYKNEAPDDDRDTVGPALTDAEAKRPGKAANVREAPARQSLRSAKAANRDHIDAARQGPHLQESLRAAQLAAQGRACARRLGRHQGDDREGSRRRSSRR